MIPEFPKFKKIELSDREEVEKFTRQFPPYSDFNFTSMWCWDVHGLISIAQLRNNLIVQLGDYLTGEKIFSLIGNNAIDAAAATLLEYCRGGGITPILRLVPEIIAEKLNPAFFTIKEDRDHFDYLYEIKKMTSYQGPVLKSRRNDCVRFAKEHGDVEIKIMNLHEKSVQEKIIRLTKKWETGKIDRSHEAKIENELKAITRMLAAVQKLNLVTLGIFTKDTLIGFCVTELLPSGFALSHFAKADTNYKGIYAYLMQHEAKVLASLDKKFLNYEQDLGISWLRHSKLSYAPVNFLKKYTVSLKS